MSTLITTLLLSAVSAILMALGCFVRRLARVCGILTLVWLAAALPILFFLNIGSEFVLLFYLISAVCGLMCNFGGRPT